MAVRQRLSARRRHTRRNNRKEENHRAGLQLETLETRLLLAREVTGTLTADDTWSGTIHVTGDLTVEAGVRLVQVNLGNNQESLLAALEAYSAVAPLAKTSLLYTVPS